jgi:hypothetical protein
MSLEDLGQIKKDSSQGLHVFPNNVGGTITWEINVLEASA